MRTLLRHTGTRLYYQGPDRWTNNPDRAYDFKFIYLALQHAEIMELKEVELAFIFNDPRHVTALPLAQAALRYASP